MYSIVSLIEARLITMRKPSSWRAMHYSRKAIKSRQKTCSKDIIREA